jgi:hypothetical protein
MGAGTASPPSVLEQHARLAEPSSAEQRSDVAVRHRRDDLSWQDIVVSDDPQLVAATSSSSGTSAGSGAPSAPPSAPATDAASRAAAERLVVEAWLSLETADVGNAVDAIRARVEAGGGRVVSENVTGAGKSASSAALELRVPPAQATGMATWLGTLGHITSKRVQASDVSKTLFDQELALQNLMLTMERLQKLATQSGPVTDLLAIEKEMTRVRGEIETIKGEQRWLLDRVAFATISVSISREGEDIDYDPTPQIRIQPGPQLAMLSLLDPGMRERTRVGGGVSVRVQRYATFELSVFPRGDGGDSRAVLATFGTALYSGFLGHGRRRYLNPYIGARVGYGYLSDNGSPVLAGELGVELVKHKYLVVDASARALAFMTSSPEGALQAALGVSVPF